MSQDTLDLADNGNTEEQVINYLKDHPDFLLTHPEILAIQEIPHETGGAVSLIERKLKILEERSENYRSQLEELVGIARENDQMYRRLHQFSLKLIEAEDFEDAICIVKEELRIQFQADAVELKLFSAEELAAHANEPDPAMFEDFVEAESPSCGPLTSDQLHYLFGSQAGETGSAALIPISSPLVSGVLAIGSRDGERFHPGKGVDFLSRLGELVTLILQCAAQPVD